MHHKRNRKPAMSTPFYDLASLVVVPSGYKSGKIYAQKPLTTDGQLTFTRASTATRVNASGLIESVASGVPRLDYQGSTCPKLLLEPQRTNSVLYSEQFENGVWARYSTGTVTTNSAISPDGTLDADLFVPNTTNYQHSIEQNMGTTSGTITMSVYAKASGYNWLVLNAYVGGTKNTFFDLQNGVIGTIASGVTASIQSAGNGWYRIICTVAGGANTYISLSPTTANNVLSFAGNGTSGILLWGAQVETGAYATSYIPTTSAAVTRLADDCKKTSISSLIGQTAGTVFYEFTFDNFGESAGEKVLWYMKDGGTGERYLTVTDTQVLAFVDASGGVVQANLQKTGITVGTYKVAIAYANNDFVMYVNGTLASSDTSGTVAGFSTFGLQYYSLGAAGRQMAKQALLFTSRLTNAQLAELTTL